MANNEKTTKENDVYIVETPVKNYNGTVAGVQFAYGKAEVRSGWILNWFKENGYITKKKWGEKSCYGQQKNLKTWKNLKTYRTKR